MTKLFIKNKSTSSNVAVRIFKLQNAATMEIPPAFTVMDELNSSMAIELLPAPAITCVGVVARAGGLEAPADEALTVSGNGQSIIAEGIESLRTALERVGYQADLLTPWVYTGE